MLDARWLWIASVGALVACNSGTPGADDTPTAGVISESVSGTGAESDTEAVGTDTEDSGQAGCSADGECGDGQVCSDGTCISGCGNDSECSDGESCCDASCVNVMSDAAHCGSCGDPCGEGLMCMAGECGTGECEEGRYDCNGDPADGCEAAGECACAPGDTQECYTGAAETMGVGACVAGTQTCNAFGTAWSGCEGEVNPMPEVCGNGIDENCNTLVDEDVDEDGDGFTTCAGDCCDTPGPNCLQPELVNPGAFEVDGNDVDDDCDGMPDNPLDACDMGLASNSADPLDYARGIDLCQFTEEDPADPSDRIWGVIEAALELADGGGVPDANSRALRDGFGANIANEFGDRMVVLSTGHAADNTDDANPGFAAFQQGQQMGETSGVPADWLAANGDTLPNAPGCPGPGSQTAFNPVNLRLRVRAPTNANSFSVRMFFFSAEYPEYVCTAFNDFFVTLVDSTDPENPADKNIAIYDDGANTWPVGINLVSAAAGLFTACDNGAIAHCEAGGTYNGCAANTELQGTGFDLNASECGHNGPAGGGTGWLTMTGAVEPGEVLEIRFIIWDTSDEVWDSLVLLDDWEWSVEASPPGVDPG